MKYCQQCGAQLSADSVFCGQCGSRVEPAEPMPAEDLQPVSQEFQAAAEAIPPVYPPGPVPGPVPPSPPPQAVQQPVYGYGGGPPQAPPPYYGGAQAPYPPQAPYPYPPGAYPPPGYGAPYQAPKRKKRWWIPLVILVVILGLLAGSWVVFGDQIQLLFMSTDKKWRKAEAQSALVPDDSLLNDLQGSLDRMLKQTKLGSTTEIGLDIKADTLPDEMAELLTVLTSLRFRLDYKVDRSETDPRFYTRVGLGKRDESGDLLSMEIYDVNQAYVVAIPELFDRPFVADKDALANLTGMEGDDLLNAGSKAGLLADDSIEKIFDGLKDIFMKYAGEPQLVKGQEVTVGDVSQTLDYYDVTVEADQFPAMAKEMLLFLRNSPELKNLLAGMGSPEDLMMGMATSEDAYDSFVEGIDDSLRDLERHPDEYKIKVRRMLYVDKKNKPAGGRFTLTKAEDGKDEVITIESLHVTDGSRHGQILKLDMADEGGLEFQSSYKLDKELYTGTFSLRFKERDWGQGSRYMELMGGDYTAFGLQKAGSEAYPVGKMTLKITSGEDDEYYDAQEIKLIYEGRLEARDGVQHLLATLEIVPEVDDLAFSLIIRIDHAALPLSQVVFPASLPSDYLDISDEEALAELMEGSNLEEKLAEILEKFGLDPDLLGGMGGGYDWDDYDDDFNWDDWDWD